MRVETNRHHANDQRYQHHPFPEHHEDEEATMATTTPLRPVRPTASSTIPAQRPAAGAPTAREALRPSVRVGAARQARPPAPRTRAYRAETVHHQGVRLTRRGRLVVFGAAVVLLLLAVVLLRPGGPAFAGDTDTGPATQTIVVQHGQTMWQIARDIRPGADPRDTVRRIQELNGLTTAQVWAGQPLVVPN